MGRGDKFFLEVAIQLENVLLEMLPEARNVDFVPLILFECSPCRKQILWRYNVPVKVVIDFH